MYSPYSVKYAGVESNHYSLMKAALAASKAIQAGHEALVSFKGVALITLTHADYNVSCIRQADGSKITIDRMIEAAIGSKGGLQAIGASAPRKLGRNQQKVRELIERALEGYLWDYTTGPNDAPLNTAAHSAQLHEALKAYLK